MRQIPRLLAIPFVLAALGACDPPPQANADSPRPAAGDTGAAPGDLASARRAWEARRPASYAFTLTISCFCVHRGDYAVEVRDGRIASVRTPEGESVPDDRAGRAVTVDQLFQMIADAAGQGTPTRVVYDRALGYPAEAEIGTIANDAGTVYHIRDLRRL